MKAVFAVLLVACAGLAGCATVGVHPNLEMKVWTSEQTMFVEVWRNGHLVQVANSSDNELVMTLCDQPGWRQIIFTAKEGLADNDLPIYVSSTDLQCLKKYFRLKPLVLAGT